MGLKERLRASLERQRRAARERAAYRKIVAQKTQLASRQAYSAEAVIQARLKAQRIAKARYNRPSWSESLRQSISSVQMQPKKSIAKKPIKRRRKTTRNKRRRTV